jgi:uncharacterized sulfatase
MRSVVLACYREWSVTVSQSKLICFTAGLALVAQLTCSSPLLAQSHKSPNVVVILADDLGWSDLACYGNRFNESPQIDRLAEQGIRFTQFYAGPVCSPTRANLQSGQDQARFGITQHIPGHRRPFAKLIDPLVPSHLPLDATTFAERLQSVGYATAYFGKWHLGGDGFGPAAQGWQRVVETRGHTTGQDSSRNNPNAPPRRTAEYLTQLAVDFMTEHRERPFLLQVSHHLVHIPLNPTPQLLEVFQQKPPQADYPSHAAYAALLRELDQSVGAVVQAVDDLGLSERTLILFLSDNGGLEHEQSGRVVTSNRPLRGEKGTLYEGGIRVPAIARWTNHIPAGTICATPAITQDMYPTLLELAGISVDPVAVLDGVSLLPLLTNPEGKLPRESLYWHLPHYHHGTPASAIRQGDWKLIEYLETGQRELFDLRNDLQESNDLADSKPEIAARLHESLKGWRDRVGARMPVPNPDYDPERASELAGSRSERSRPRRP